MQSLVGLEILNRLFVAIEPSPHVAGNRVEVYRTVSIAQNLLGTVVTRNDDITVLGIKHIVNSAIQHFGVHLGVSQLDFTRQRSHEVSTIGS